MARIGFIGLGHMGLPMAINLIKAGHTVTGFDLQNQALTALRVAGGQVAQTLIDAAINQDIMITMLQTGQQVKQVCLGKQGLFAHALPECLYIDCSSIDVPTSRYVHQQATLKNIAVVDAPVSGGVASANAATLTFIVGGTAQAFNQAQPILAAMGKKIIHTGTAGNGQAAKICNNMILGISMIAVAEAFILAEHLGLSAAKLFEVVNNSSGQCWVTSHYPPVPQLLPDVPANNDYQPGFTAAMMLKDLCLSQDSASKVGINTSMGAHAREIYQQFKQAGFGELDFSAIIKIIEPCAKQASHE